MSQKVIRLLQQHGPMLSGELARRYETEYGASNTAARQALSRAKQPVHKIQTLSFANNQKFFYLEKQYSSNQFFQRLLDAVKANSQVNWRYICAFNAQNGYVSRNFLPAMTGTPVQRVKGHKLHSRVVEDLLQCRIIEEYSETHWKLCNWASGERPQNIARAAGLETVKKQVVNDFSKWAANINLIGYHSAETFTSAAVFAQFQWALTAPSYVQPLYDPVRQKPGFLVADVFYGRQATLEDIQFFLDKVAIARSFKKLPAFFPVLLVESVTSEALRTLKENKVTVALIQNIFDERYTHLLAEIVSAFTNASAILVKNPEKIESLFRELAEAEGRYNNIIGDMFELLVGYYYQRVGCYHLEIRKTVQIPDSGEKNEIDVLVEKDGRIIVVECKATRSPVDGDFTEKWLSKNIVRIRKWLLGSQWMDFPATFQLWSLGGFTPEALEKLTEAAARTKKYQIEFFNEEQILSMAKQQKVQPVIDVLKQHFQPTISGS